MISLVIDQFKLYICFPQMSFYIGFSGSTFFFLRFIFKDRSPSDCSEGVSQHYKAGVADRSGLSGLARLERHFSFLNARPLLNNIFMLLLITHIHLFVRFKCLFFFWPLRVLLRSLQLAQRRFHTCWRSRLGS